MPNTCAAIVIAAKHHELTKVKDTRGTTNTIGALRCRFEFRTDDWLHSTKTAMFCNGDALLHPEVAAGAVPVLLDEDNECAVPFEVLTDNLPYSVGVWGVTDTGLRIVSRWIVFDAQDGCYVEGNEPIEPTPTVYEQIMVELGSKAPASHEHDDRYYTREEVDDKFAQLNVSTDLVDQIEKNTKSRHEHTNKELLDKFSEGPNGNPLYNGKEISSSVDKEEISKEIEDALAEAKASGDFDGADGQTPYIKNGNWWVGDIDTGVKAEGTNGSDGVSGSDGVGVEKAEINNSGELVLTYSDGNTDNLGVIVGTDGKDGQDGISGEDGGYYTPLIQTISSSQIALKFQPSKEGMSNPDSAILTLPAGQDGKDGSDGQDGASAYEVATSNGYDGTESEWLESLKGDDGTSIGIASISESTEDGGVNTVIFTDGQMFSVKNGKKGDDGAQGESGVYIGAEEPSSNVNVWINPEGMSSNNVATTKDVETAITNALANIGIAEEGVF